ncbi:MAG: VWA domain-containing protein [Xanthomonadales bacterium]|nr:VWA domain-containing protein [Xanthomonadales bacterium]
MGDGDLATGHAIGPQSPSTAQVTNEQEFAVRKAARDQAQAIAPRSLHPPPASGDAQLRHATEPLYREQYSRPEDNRVTRVSDNPVSTFSIDVDTGAYSNARRWLSQGQLPPEDAVRVEEFINYFDYEYRVPTSRKQPFLVETEVAPTPWNRDTHLFRIGIQGYEVPKYQLPAANLVFLVDVSGSMRSHDKLPLLKQALGMLAQQLSARDCISIVVYAGSSGVVLPPTPGNQAGHIMNALNRLEAGGSTNGAAGIRLAYQLARQKFKTNGVNRVILATDGDFNVGLASTEELVDMVQRERDGGVALTTLGFGTGNYNDHLLEQLANEGNGNHAYIDRLSEARKVLQEQLSATLLTIASDVKIQVEFNPEAVAEYRLIGYENRALNEEDFNNDRIDAGEIGAGHRVTALYEISLTDSGYRRLPERRYAENGDAFAPPRGHDHELAHLRIRYKAPGQSRSKLIEAPVMKHSVMTDSRQASDDFRFAAAVAAFGQRLRGGAYLGGFGYRDIAQLAQQARGSDRFGYRGEFIQLVGQAEVLDPGREFALDHDQQ